MTCGPCDIYVFVLYTHLADDVRDCISSFDPVTSLGVDPKSHMNVREALLIWVVLRIFSQSLERKHNEQTVNSKYNVE